MCDRQRHNVRGCCNATATAPVLVVPNVPPVRPIHRKEPQPDTGNVVQVEIGMRNQFVASFRSGIQGRWILYSIRLLKGDLDIVAINAGRRGVDERVVLQAQFDHDFENVDGTVDIVAGVFQGMVETVSYSRLCCQVNEARDVMFQYRLLESVDVAHISPHKLNVLFL